MGLVVLPTDRIRPAPFHQTPQPYYVYNFGNVLIFASFMIITFFMIHNIILSRIFQIYSDKLKQTAVKRCASTHPSPPIHTHPCTNPYPHHPPPHTQAREPAQGALPGL